MECPFELPVEKAQMPKNTKGIKLYRIDKVYFPYTEEEVDYIIKAINSHEKLKKVIRAALRISDLWTLKEVETMFEDEAKALAIMKTDFEQALEAEKK